MDLIVKIKPTLNLEPSLFLGSWWAMCTERFTY
uniref:Uncharacterized protein n=1 Tax=Arundo donax TaxID=35708 RepID=A0A0A9B8X8_ARUDO